jgi:predicted negative regulator of RcsB-dependent stress response
MSAQTTVPRARKQQRVEPDDVVLARALEFSNWARANIKLVVGGAVVILAVVAALLWWRADQAERQERAAMEFLQLEQTVASGNAELAARDLEQFTQRFAGTDYAEEATVMLGSLRLQTGHPAAAIEAVEELAARPDRSLLAANAAMLLAAAQHAAGQTDVAIATYLRVAETAEMDFQRVEALASAARLRSESGEHAGAAELYARAVELSDAGSTDRTVYEMRRAEAEARAAAGS